MKAQKYGRIINTASHAALFGEKGFAAYNMAKGAVMALTRVASQEWAQHGITTNTILPVVRTEAYDMSQQGKDFATYLETAMPSGRFAPPEEIVSSFTFLASEGASYVNGQALGLDGGWHLIA
jgi:3-oxoacyl-[acyl-carrier protein] reductase